MPKENVNVTHLIFGLVKKIPQCKTNYFLEPYSHDKNKIKFVTFI